MSYHVSYVCVSYSEGSYSTVYVLVWRAFTIVVLARCLAIECPAVFAAPADEMLLFMR